MPGWAVFRRSGIVVFVLHGGLLLSPRGHRRERSTAMRQPSGTVALEALICVWLAHSARTVWCLWLCACRCIARWDPSPRLRWQMAWLLLEALPRHARGSSGVAEATTASAENGSCGLLAWWQPRVSRTASASRVHVASTAVTSSVCFHAHSTAPQGSYRRIQLCRGASYA